MGIFVDIWLTGWISLANGYIDIPIYGYSSLDGYKMGILIDYNGY